MKQEDKELSFIDISGRLHYGIIVNYKENEYDHREWKIDTLHALSYSREGTLIDTSTDGWIGYEEYKGCGMSTGSRPFRFGEVLPYLRPMSSMTDKEKEEFQAFHCVYEMHPDFQPMMCNLSNELNMFNWLNKKMFDYRGLIPMNLAIEVTEDNNPYK